MTVELIAHTPEPEKIVAAAAKLCYSQVGAAEVLNGLTPEKTSEFVKMLASLGHESPTEHVSFTFAIDGVSRSLLAQITRHRIASYSVQSQRYVRLENFEYILPPEIEADPVAKEQYEIMMKQQADGYTKLAGILKENRKNAFLAEGDDEKTATRKSEKMAIEDARFVLPNACDTKMIVTMNARSLNNFFHHRCCTRAQWEIRALADEMLKLVYNVSPSLFVKSGPSCIAGVCPEGRMTCGKTEEMRSKYKLVKGIS